MCFLLFYLTGVTLRYSSYSRSPVVNVFSGILCRGERDVGRHRSFRLFSYNGDVSSFRCDEDWGQKPKQNRNRSEVSVES